MVWALTSENSKAKAAENKDTEFKINDKSKKTKKGKEKGKKKNKTKKEFTFVFHDFTKQKHKKYFKPQVQLCVDFAHSVYETPLNCSILHLPQLPHNSTKIEKREKKKPKWRDKECESSMFGNLV